jgi:transcriptional regulator with XRE-family HTH domain
MTVPIDNTAAILRKRFGAWLKQKREEIGMTQLVLCVEIDYATPTMISQVERGASALPEHDLMTWADILRIDRAEFAKQYAYYCRPFVYEGLYGKDPFRAEKLPRAAKTIKSRPIPQKGTVKRGPLKVVK